MVLLQLARLGTRLRLPAQLALLRDRPMAAAVALAADGAGAPRVR